MSSCARPLPRCCGPTARRAALLRALIEASTYHEVIARYWHDAVERFIAAASVRLAVRERTPRRHTPPPRRWSGWSSACITRSQRRTVVATKPRSVPSPTSGLQHSAFRPDRLVSIAGTVRIGRPASRGRGVGGRRRGGLLDLFLRELGTLTLVNKPLSVCAEFDNTSCRFPPE